MSAKSCQFNGCSSNEARGKSGYCHGHFSQLQRGRKLTPITRTTEERFWSRVVKGKESECWTWTGSTNGVGYGEIRIAGVKVYAHRYSFELHSGTIPPGKSIDHICRVPGCVNPRHLQAVTHSENHQNRTAQVNNKTGFRGVTLLPSGKYLVQVRKGAEALTRSGVIDLKDAVELAKSFRRELFVNSQEDYNE